ncbi:MAG: methionine sulfoxide reductase heme-binding subunit [Thermoleophilaceae bacterium]|nr:methionine sulfoxide reductase heme-binding subunit [Thermoleophilaceae bacterium]
MIASHAWWLASRAVGIVAYLALSASVVMGLSMALRIAPVRFRPGLRVTHERVALIALAGILAHGLLLLPDSWLRPTIVQLVVPFDSGYRPLWTGLGIVAMYLAAALSLTYYARRRIGVRRWRNAHRLIPIAWGLSAVHVLGAGTDAGSLWLEIVLALTTAAIVALLGARLAGDGRSKALAPAPPRVARTAPVSTSSPSRAASPAGPLWMDRRMSGDD